VLGATALAFLLPAAIGRLIILIPVTLALADQVGFKEGRPGRAGLVLATLLGTFFVPMAILPANVPNVALAGAADTLHGITFNYGHYLLLHFPITGALKGVIIVALICRVFRDRIEPDLAAQSERSVLTREGRRLAVILGLALGAWATDSLHGIAPGWVAAAAGLVCLLPGLGLVPPAAFRERVSLATLLYVAGVLGIGAVIADSGAGALIAQGLFDVADLDPGQPAKSYTALSATAILLSLVATLPGAAVVMASFADQAAAVGLGRITVGQFLKITLPLTAISLVLILPLNYVWWRLIGVIP
jgi:di/tricarboxylate transporter